jgi:hypothetical protein
MPFHEGQRQRTRRGGGLRYIAVGATDPPEGPCPRIATIREANHAGAFGLWVLFGYPTATRSIDRKPFFCGYFTVFPRNIHLY